MDCVGLQKKLIGQQLNPNTNCQQLINCFQSNFILVMIQLIGSVNGEKKNNLKKILALQLRFNI